MEEGAMLRPLILPDGALSAGIGYAQFLRWIFYRNGCAKEVSKKFKDGKNKKWTYKGNNGSEREAGHHRYNREDKTTMVWPRQKDARGQNTKINYGMDTTREKEKRTSKKNVDGMSASSHDNKKFRTRSMEKQRGMAFGFRKTATALKNPDR